LKESELAVVLAESADLASDLWRALLIHGNAQRIAGNLLESERCFLQASALQPQLDAGDLAWFYSLQASLFNAKGEQKRACELIDLAISASQRTQDISAVGRLLVQEAFVMSAFNPLEALRTVNRALDVIDPRDVGMILLAHHNAAEVYLRAGRPQRALQVITRISPLYERVEVVGLHGARWMVAGETFKDLGLLNLAEENFRRSLGVFATRGQRQSQGFVQLELASILVDLGRKAEAGTLIRQAIENLPDRRELTGLLQDLTRESVMSALAGIKTLRP
jgi:tetratricopeptide (TPR) repeat protein